MKRILLDQGLPPDAARILRAEGWEALHVREAGLSRAADQEILAFARADGRVCVTLDRDFHAHIALDRAHSPSVLLLRWQGLDAPALVDVLKKVWPRIEESLADGVAITATESALRIRRLPIR